MSGGVWDGEKYARRRMIMEKANSFTESCSAVACNTTRYVSHDQCSKYQAARQQQETLLR